MIKKIIFTCLFIGIVFSLTIQKAFAYSPHYLPGGKNYLSSDNFSVSGQYYESTQPFLVKTYTSYTLTVPRLYADDPMDDIRIEFYQNANLVDELYQALNDLTYYDDGVNEWYYFTFTTMAESNYIKIRFDNNNDYFTGYGVSQVQLEEGTSFTGYESYIQGTVLDTTAPYFQNAGTIISYVDSPITVSEIQSSLVAFDDIDGDVTASISVFSDGYTENQTVLGSYPVVFEVSDSSSNSSQVTVDVEVVDVLKPVFSQLETIQAVYPNTYTTADILAMLSASDNYDGDLSSNIILVNDNYSANANTVGIYTMDFSVTDSSGNIETYTQHIEVVDQDGPIISGVTSIIVGYNEYLSQSQVESNLSFTDNYDDSSILSLHLENDTYTASHTRIGSYVMEFSVTDSSGNQTTQVVTIEVVDEIGPMVYFDESVIQTYTDTVMALPDFTQLLVNARELDRYTDYLITVKYDSYTKNADKPGVYHLQLKLEDEDGFSLDKELEIRVIERPVDYIYLDDSIEETQTFLEKNLTLIISGGMSFVLIGSNVTWFLLTRKKG